MVKHKPGFKLTSSEVSTRFYTENDHGILLVGGQANVEKIFRLYGLVSKRVGKNEWVGICKICGEDQKPFTCDKSKHDAHYESFPRARSRV